MRNSRNQKHKPKWVTHEIIDASITITDIELCAMWTPLSIVCGSGWFLDDSVKSKMVSFAPLMKKQSYWMISRFIRASILMKELGEDVGVDARQDIFLYSSKIGILPGFPTPNTGWPTSTAEWMTVTPYFRNAMETDEMKAFMKRYGYKTREMVKEELRIMKELEEKREAEKKEAERIESEIREAEEKRQLENDEERKKAEENAAIATLETLSGPVGTDVEFSDMSAVYGGDDIICDTADGENIAMVMGKSCEKGLGLIMGVKEPTSIQKGIEGLVTKSTKVIDLEKTKSTKFIDLEKQIVIKKEPEMASEVSDLSSTETSSADSSTLSSEESGAEEDDYNIRRDFATSMRLEVSTKMTEEDFLSGQ